MTFRVLNIYDANLNKSKKVYCNKHSLQRGKGAIPLGSNFIFKTYTGKIFVCGGEDLIIDLYDLNGEKLYSLNQ